MSIENVGFLVVRNNRAVSSVGRASRLHRACPLLISPANPSLLQYNLPLSHSRHFRAQKRKENTNEHNQKKTGQVAVNS